MMSKEKRRVPKLRFPGFTEDWEQRKLGDYLSIPEKEILEVASSDDLITVKLNLGGIELGASRDTLSLGSTVYYKRYAGQFIYGKQNFFNGSMGLIPTNLDGKGSSGDVPSFNVSNIEENYLYTYVSRESYWRSKVAAASGTGSKRIHEKTFLDFNIDVPSMDEQKLISNTFDLIDRFITLHQRKLEHLNLKKKGLLQKLFPKNGERYPELRFPGFTDAWEQRKLGSLATVEMNKRIFKEQTTTKGDIPFYKIGTFGSDADSFISRDLFEEYKNKYPYPNIGDILISASGSIGRPVVYNGEDAYYQDSNIVWLNHNGKIDNSFLLQFYNQVKWAGLEGSTIKRLYNKNILETYIAVPKIEEQRLIGEFFKLVDSSITLHQQEPFLCGNSVNGGVELC